MLSEKIEKALNEQVNAEFWSAYLYLSMSAYFDAQGRKGIANWYMVQFQEEQAHALNMMNYLHARGSRTILKPITEVPTEWKSILDAFYATLEHEQKVTSMIHALYAMAEEERDYATRQMLNAYVAEQVEEEENVQQIIDNLRLVGEDGTGLYQIDTELGKRVFTAPQF